MLRLALFAILVQVCLSSKNCDDNCYDYYRNCDPDTRGLSSDKKGETINCKEEYFQLRCPKFCSVCTGCDFVEQWQLKETKDDLEDDIEDVEDDNEDLENKVDDLEDKIDDLLKEKEAEKKISWPIFLSLKLMNWVK